jgi:predicted nuclease of predicted toxin-antitoxin system
MKILLDEQLPVKLKYRFKPEIEISTVRDENWLGKKNGELIALAIEGGFTIFITNDQNLSFQQKLTQFKILFININQPVNRYESILPAIQVIKQWLSKNETNIGLMIETKNYLIYPVDLNL